MGDITLTSADEDIVAVDEDGNIEGMAPGETTVTVASGDITADVIVTVIESAVGQAFLTYDGSGDHAPGLYDIELFTNDMEALVTANVNFAAAERYDGIIYIYDTNGNFYRMDAETYELLDMVATTNFPQDMTYDYTTNAMYGVTENRDDDSLTDLVTIDLETGEMEVVETLDFYAMTLAARDGIFYGIELHTGTLYNITEGEILLETEAPIGYLQTMAFDHSTGILYWLGLMGSGKMSFTAAIDVETKTFTVHSIHEEVYEFVGLMFPVAEGEESVPVTGVTLDKTELEMPVLGEETLTATVTPENATNKRVNWSSSDESVATVDRGVVEALSAGTTTITATTLDGRFTATCEVTVVGDMTTLLYEDFEDDLEGWTVADVDGDNFNWQQLYGTEVSTSMAFEGDGLIVSASYDNATYQPLTPDNWLITPSFEASTHTKLSFHAVGVDPEWPAENYSVYILPADAENLNEATQIYTDVASGEWERIVLNLAEFAGEEVRIAFRHHDVTDMFRLGIDLVEVIDVDLGDEPDPGPGPGPDPDPVPVTGVVLDKTEASLEVGGTLQLTATVAPEDATNKELVWTTSDAAVATVSETGLVTAVAAGTATITVTTVDGEFTATCTITVTEAEPEYILGDVNGDGVVNTGDAVMILRHVAEIIELAPEQLLAADANGDDVVNTGDAVAILRFVAGLITEL